MKEINIEITKALLTKITIEIKKEGIPEIDGVMDLLSFDNKKIASYTATSGNWRTPKMDLPVETFVLIKRLEEIIEVEATRSCRAELKLLPVNPYNKEVE